MLCLPIIKLIKLLFLWRLCANFMSSRAVLPPKPNTVEEIKYPWPNFHQQILEEIVLAQWNHASDEHQQLNKSPQQNPLSNVLALLFMTNLSNGFIFSRLQNGPIIPLFILSLMFLHLKPLMANHHRQSLNIYQGPITLNLEESFSQSSGWNEESCWRVLLWCLPFGWWLGVCSTPPA